VKGSGAVTKIVVMSGRNITVRWTHFDSRAEYSTKVGRAIHLEYCKISSFHGGENEECRLLGYKNPVRTSQETRLRYRVQPVNAM
jgi:hypothetical protein